MLGRSAAVVALLAVVGVEFPASQPVPAPTRAAVASPPRSPRNASYVIRARLDPASRTLRGDELLTWRNISTTPARTLQFHLYYNAWRNTRSTWMKELLLAGDPSLAGRPEEDWGWIDITSLRILRGGAPDDATGRMRFVAPDDGNSEDRTVAEVPLATPVAPGETINVEVAWSARVPRTFARTGVVGNFYFLAQWFPKIGVLEDSGWNCHQFHAGTEFFADFGTYDVRLTVPAGWVVGATGLESGRSSAGDGTTTHHYYAEDVHDFAWTTSPDYLERVERFEHPTLPPVTMRLLLQPEHARQAARHFTATRATLRYYGEWFGPYPYSYITIVDPAWGSGADGMEYPTLFTAGTRWLAPAGVATPEEVTIHEAGHQFWYGVVATNEFEHAWMDEGIDTFATARVLSQIMEPRLEKRYFGGFIPWTFHDLRQTREDAVGLSLYRLTAGSDAPSTPAWRFWPARGGGISYSKTALWLHTLERMLGWDVLQRSLSTYYSRWAFKHPRPADFFAIVNEVSGQDLTWFFDEVYRSARAFDYGVEDLRSGPVDDRGHFGEGSSRAFRRGASAEARTYRTTVVLRRHEQGVFPVDVRVGFADGQERRWRWDGREAWKVFEVEHGSPARDAQVDPDRVLLLDANVTNNSVSLAPAAPAAARKWSLAWMIWLQDHLLTYGLFV